MVMDANDVIDEITLDGGREMWTEAKWKEFLPRLRRWMRIWEVTGGKHGLEEKSGFLFGRTEAGIADIVTATLWGTMRDKFPSIGQLLTAEAPRTAALCHRLRESPALARLAEISDEKYGTDTYCGGQIGESLRKVAG
jgi:glutathione S-transferase